MGLLPPSVPAQDLPTTTEEWSALDHHFQSMLHHAAQYYFNVPGRIEICGNHVDHNHGKVLAASITADMIAAVSMRDDHQVLVYSQGWEDPFRVDTRDVQAKPEEAHSPAALIRGLAFWLQKQGYNTGGFSAVIHSKIPIGSGLSSSAAMEILLGLIFSFLYQKGEIDALSLAQAGQFAENNYLRKPCGLMDQIACVWGQAVEIDFSHQPLPTITPLIPPFEEMGWGIGIVHTSKGHDDMTGDYSTIPAEMHQVATSCGTELLGHSNEARLMEILPEIRHIHGDRAILRALHFFSEVERVESQCKALKKKDMPSFLSLVQESGSSSWRWLQNVHTETQQELALTLALTERFFQQRGIPGACRVHGGGFAGTILVFLRKEQVPEYQAYIEEATGKGSFQALGVRTVGGCRVER